MEKAVTAEARILSADEDERGVSWANSFWGQLLNPGPSVLDPGYYDLWRPVKTDPDPAMNGWRPSLQGVLSDKRIVDALIANEMLFEWTSNKKKHAADGIITFRDGDDVIYMAGVNIAMWETITSPEMLTTIASQDTEMWIVQWVDVWDKQKSMAEFKSRAKERRGVAEMGVEATEGALIDIGTMLEADGADAELLVDHRACIFVFGRSLDELTARCATIRRMLGNFGVRGYRETAHLEHYYLGLFPPHEPTIRSNIIMTGNVAGLTAFDAAPQGHGRCDWGPRPLTLFKTAQGSPYGFTFHHTEGPAASGHTVVIGTNGSGKTTLINFLAHCALGYDDAHVFGFDRLNGSYVATKAVGGEYIRVLGDSTNEDINVGNTGIDINPFLMPALSDPGNKRVFDPAFSWLLQWMYDAILRMDSTQHTDEKEQFEKLMLKVCTNPDRKECNMAEVYRNLHPTGPIAQSLQPWATGAYANYFNGQDRMSLAGNNRLTYFDMTRAHQDERMMAALIPYLMERVATQMRMQRTPFLFVLDELAALMRSPTFASNYTNWLEEWRKARGVVVSMFQHVGQIQTASLAVRTAITSQNKTTIVFPQESIDVDSYRDLFNFTDRECQTIAKRSEEARRMAGEGGRWCLLKREDEGAVILNVDLRNLGDYLKIYYSGDAPASLAAAMMRNYGDDWVNQYLADKGAHPVVTVEPV